MKNLLLSLVTIFIIQSGYCQLFSKSIKITVDQEDALIYVDNNYVGVGTYIATFKKKEGHIRVRIEKEGFVTARFIVRADDKRKSIDMKLIPDESWNASVSSDIANKYFTLPVSKDFIKRVGSEEEAAKQVWKLLHSILMNYIEEIEESNQWGGYIQSAWVIKEFPSAAVKIRTRVTIKETNVGGDLTYRVKISSEIAPLNATSDEQYEQWERILRTYEPMIQEFQARIGKF